jgi:hypothetical protein
MLSSDSSSDGCARYNLLAAMRHIWCTCASSADSYISANDNPINCLVSTI